MSEYCPHCDDWDYAAPDADITQVPPCSRPDCDGNRVRWLDWQARAEAAEAEVERLNRIIAESKPWIDMAADLADRDRRILDALAILDPAIRSEWGRYDGGLAMLTRVRNALRGDA